jgi:hypothetical protein
MALTRNQVIAMYDEEVKRLKAVETKQKHRRKLISSLRRQFEAMPIIVEERPDEIALKADK